MGLRTHATPSANCSHTVCREPKFVSFLHNHKGIGCAVCPVFAFRRISIDCAKLHHAAPHQSKQCNTEQNGTKLCLLVLKKKLVFVNAQASSTFCARTFKKKPKLPRKRHHWVTPLFKGRDSAKTSSLGNTIIQKWNISIFWIMVLPNDDVFGELYTFFRNIFLQNILKKMRKVPWKHHLYFWIMVLPNDDVFAELYAFFSTYIIIHHILEKNISKKMQSFGKMSSLSNTIIQKWNISSLE